MYFHCLYENIQFEKCYNRNSNKVNRTSTFMKIYTSKIERKIGFDNNKSSFRSSYQEDESLLVVDISELDDDAYEDTDEDEESWDQDLCFIL